MRHAREFGFPIEAIRALLDLSDHPKRPCGDAHALATAQLAEVEEKLRRLRALRAELVGHLPWDLPFLAAVLVAHKATMAYRLRRVVIRFIPRRPA